MAELLYGAPVAEMIRRETEKIISGLSFAPRMAILRMSGDASQLAYEQAVKKYCAGLGIEAESRFVPIGALRQTVEDINRQSSVHGCMILCPLPEGEDSAALDALAPEKDIDGASALSLGRLFTGRGEFFAPCTAEACLELLDYYKIELAGARVCVIGRSLAVGKPLAAMLERRNATVTICSRSTRELAAVCRQADILIPAAGAPGLVDGGFTCPGQVIIDVGISSVGGKTLGDVDMESAAPVAGAVSPVPGGVGSVTTAVLAKHTALAAWKEVHL